MLPSQNSYSPMSSSVQRKSDPHKLALWVVWEHEGIPSPVQYFCDSCYKDFNFDTYGKKIFSFKSAPLYDRHNRKFAQCTSSTDDLQLEEDD
ncbi:hypothetical protein COOONC_03111 [Cooperia oncophora]